MGIAGLYLAEVDAPEAEWHQDIAVQVVASVLDAPESVRDEELLRFAAHPFVKNMINFAADRWPGTDCSEDATWAATIALERREIAVKRDVGIDGGLGALNFAVLDWIEQRIGCWDDQTFPVAHPRESRRAARCSPTWP